MTSLTGAGCSARYVSISVCAMAHGGGARKTADTLALAVLVPATAPVLACALAAELDALEEEEEELEEEEEEECALWVADAAAACGARAGGVQSERFFPFTSAVVNSARVYHRASSNSWKNKKQQHKNTRRVTRE